MTECCGNCRFQFTDPNPTFEELTVYCAEGPLVQVVIDSEPSRWRFAFVRPPAPNGYWCGRYQPRAGDDWLEKVTP
jgi:hypothetical protein